MNIVLTAGLKDITGQASTVEDLAATLARVDRTALVRHSIRILNGLAADRRTGFRSSQDAFVKALPANLKERYAAFVAAAPAPVQLLHPAQQLVLVHASARFGATAGGSTLVEAQARAAWATACLQVNDHLMKEPVVPGGTPTWERRLYLFSEDASRWELINPSRADKSLARMRVLFTDVANHTPACTAAAARLRAAFVDRLGIDFETAYNLTAFLIFYWIGESQKLGHDPDAALINRRMWLEHSLIPLAQFDRYLARVSLGLEDIVPAFDAALYGAAMSFRDVLPFRRRPLFRIDDDGIAFLAPQLMSEKGGVDLLWLLMNEPGTGREKRSFNDDFSLLYEGYVNRVFEDLGARLGGEYLGDIPYVSGEGSGQIDGLIVAGNLLAVVEVKASLLRAPLLATGSVTEVRSDLEKKFVGTQEERKGLTQLASAIHWLAAERRAGRRVRGLDLKRVDTIMPVLVVADRHLRYPGLGEWFDHRMRELVRPVWARVGPLIICGTEDLESIEHHARLGKLRFVDVLERYMQRARRATEPLWRYYDEARGPHPRLDRVADDWFRELLAQRIMLR